MAGETSHRAHKKVSLPARIVIDYSSATLADFFKLMIDTQYGIIFQALAVDLLEIEPCLSSKAPFDLPFHFPSGAAP